MLSVDSSAESSSAESLDSGLISFSLVSSATLFKFEISSSEPSSFGSGIMSADSLSSIGTSTFSLISTLDNKYSELISDCSLWTSSVISLNDFNKP